MKKVIATDLDGTLFYPKKRISMLANRTRLFLERYIEDGGKLLLVSGRNKYITGQFLRKTGLPADFIGCNGSLVISNGQIVKAQAFDREKLKTLLAAIRRDYNPPMVLLMSKRHNLVFTRSDVSHMTNVLYFIYEVTLGSYRDPWVRSDKVFYEEIETGDVYKIMILFGLTQKKILQAKEANKVLREKYQDAEFSWSDQFIEISPKGCSKKEGIEFYLDYNKIHRDNVLVVGDSGNDISMFEAWKENSFCMGHSRPEVQKHATHIIKNFYDLESYVYPLEENSVSPKRKKEK
ncbi:MAG: Cof-type HAD-IIB family hydrolase [Bacilli bacterium]|jgi:Cof subfamily protein (haloacid dehalogenase superfamily)|nr:Cof-type HAD-IIB family hydrolase [Bacilli bacterium]